LPVSHILITRPEPQAGQLAQLCADAGLRPLISPAFSFESMAPDLSPDDVWRTSRDRHLAVFTSPRSVRYGLKWIGAEELADVMIAAVGPATARMLSELGLAPGIVPDDGYTSEALLAQSTLDDRPGESLIFAAPGGRQALLNGLTAKGWQVRVLEVYRRIMLQPDAQMAPTLETAEAPISIWTSASALLFYSEVLTSAAWHKLLNQPMLVISERLAAIARSIGAQDVTVTDGPSNGAIFASVMAVAKN
jgi:uroporphyrinogen-III synthase